MKRWQHRKQCFRVAGGILLVLLVVFILPFFWKDAGFILLKTSWLSAWQKNHLVHFYRLAPSADIRRNAQLYNGGYDPGDFKPGVIYIPDKGYNYMDSLGLLLTKEFYTGMEPFRKNFSVVRTPLGKGVLNRKGQWVAHPVYDSVETMDYVVIVHLDGQSGCINEKGKFTVPLSSVCILTEYQGERLPFMITKSNETHLFGVIDDRGKERAMAAYDRLEVRNGAYLVGRSGLWGALDSSGQRVVPVAYDRIEISYYDPRYYLVRRQGSGGLHRKGDEVPVVPLLYDMADVCTPRTFTVRKNGRYGLLDRHAGMLIEPVYDTIYYHHGMDWIVTGDKENYTLRNTRDLSSPSDTYEYIDDYCEEMTIVKKENRYGVLDNKGKEIIPLIYDSISRYSNGTAVVRHDNKYAVADRNGRFLIPFSLVFVEIGDFHQERARAARFNLMSERIKKQYGFIDKQGNTVVPFIFEDGHDRFSNGLAGMRYKGYWGYIDTQGNKVINFQYDTVTRFSHGRAMVRERDVIRVIDTRGRIIQ